MTTTYTDRIRHIWTDASVREAGRRCDAILDDLLIASQAGRLTDAEYERLRRAVIAEHNAHVPCTVLTATS